MRKRLGRRIARFVFWGLTLCFCSLAGGLWFAYWYITDSETIARVVKEHAIRYLPKAILEPGRIRPSLFKGELVFHDLRLRQVIDGLSFETLRIAYLELKVNPRKLAEGKFAPREIVVGQPTLRLRSRRDGTWNLEGLLADPWPGPWIETPPIVIRNGTLELYPCEEPASASDRLPAEPPGTLSSAGTNRLASGSPPAAEKASASSSRSATPPAPYVRGTVDQSPAVLRDVSLNIKPASNGSGDLEFDGSARGDGFERLALEWIDRSENGNHRVGR